MRYLEGMRAVRQEETGEETRDFSIPGGCILCGGDLEVRMGPTGARSFCATCRWLSRPHMRKGEEGVEVIHPAGLTA
jgi:hypothetical protein